MLAVGTETAPPAPRMSWVFSTALTQRELQSIHPDLDRAVTTPPRLVCIGRLSPEKGVDHLLRALAHLRKSGVTPFPHLAILGDGPARAQLEGQCADLGLSDVVTFRGYLSRGQLSVELMQADLCVHPALTESLSKAWLDAMAHGIPVLTSQVGAAATVIGLHGERGWLVAPGDGIALANGITHALAHSAEWPAIRRRCRAYVEGRTLETWAKEIGRICAKQWGGVVEDGKLRV